MSRSRAIAFVSICMGLLGWWLGGSTTVRQPLSPCPDGGSFSLNQDGVAHCGAGATLPVGQALTLGQKFDCNQASAADFELLPGVGAALAQELVRARGSGFSSWEEIDAVAGVGAARLASLQAACEIRVTDAGL